MINLGALEGNFTGRRVMINDFGAGAPDVIEPHVVERYRVSRCRCNAGHARPCATRICIRAPATRAGVAGPGLAELVVLARRRRREQVHSVARNE